MTNAEIFVLALAGATGLPAAEIRSLLAGLLDGLPPGHGYLEHRQEQEAQQILNDLLREPEAIRRWLKKGSHLAVADGLPPIPNHTPLRKRKDQAGRRRRHRRNRRR